MIFFVINYITTSYDTNVNYGETFQTTIEIPGTYEQT